jgi:hypothetical protein
MSHFVGGDDDGDRSLREQRLCSLYLFFSAFQIITLNSEFPVVLDVSRNYNMTAPNKFMLVDSKAELHKIPARVQCTVQCADWIDEPAPPHHTVAGRSSISLTQSLFPFPSATAAANPLSATCRAVPLHPYALAARAARV